MGLSALSWYILITGFSPLGINSGTDGRRRKRAYFGNGQHVPIGTYSCLFLFVYTPPSIWHQDFQKLIYIIFSQQHFTFQCCHWNGRRGKKLDTLTDIVLRLVLQDLLYKQWKQNKSQHRAAPLERRGQIGIIFQHTGRSRPGSIVWQWRDSGNFAHNIIHINWSDWCSSEVRLEIWNKTKRCFRVAVLTRMLQAHLLFKKSEHAACHALRRRVCV